MSNKENDIYPSEAGGVTITPQMTGAGAELIRAYFYDVEADVTDSLRGLASEVFAAMTRLSAEDETK